MFLSICFIVSGYIQAYSAPLSIIKPFYQLLEQTDNLDIWTWTDKYRELWVQLPLTRITYEQTFAVDGRWTRWGTWEPCPVSCGGGIQLSKRSCTNPAPAFGGDNCEGESVRSRSCNERGCPGKFDWQSSTCTFPCYSLSHPYQKRKNHCQFATFCAFAICNGWFYKINLLLSSVAISLRKNIWWLWKQGRKLEKSIMCLT